MKKVLKFFSIMIISMLVFGFSASVKGIDYPSQVKMTGATLINGGPYHLFTVEPSNGTHAYCLDITNPAPSAGTLMNWFDTRQVFSAAQLNRMIAVIRTSEDPNYNFGMGEYDSFYVTQAALWYAENGQTPMHNTLMSSSKYGNAYRKLIAAINEANNGRDFTKESYSILVNSTNGEIAQTMSLVEIDGQKYLLSDSIFTVSAPGDYNINVTGGYLADENGNNTGKTSAQYSTSESFRIVVPVANDEKGSASVTFNVETVNSYVTSYELHAYQGVNLSGYQRMALLFHDEDKLRTSYTVSGNYDTIVKKYDIKIAKVNKDGKLIENAKLGIYTADGYAVNSYVSGKDYITVSLIAGNYYLQEISAPTGYLLNSEKKNFSIDESGNVKDSNSNVVESKTFTIVDDLPTIKIRKVNEKKIAVKQVKIVICSYDVDSKVESNCNFEWITDGTVKELTVGVDFGTIEDGSYIIKEVSAPHGYELSEPKYITVKDGALYGDLLDDNVVEFVNKAYVEVSKTDITGQKELDGATMTLLKDGKLIESWTSSSKEAHKISGLLPDEIYEIVENAAPSGYYPIQTSIKFRINNDGKVETLDCADDSKECKVMSAEEILKIKNDVTKIRISKIDISTGKELPGATLQVLNEDGSPVYQNGKLLEWESTEEPHQIEMLPIGKYKLVETICPKGYVAVTNEVLFEVKADGTIDTVVFENDVTKVLISKKDFTTGEEVEGAHLQILDADGNVIHEWTSEKEPHYIEKLPVGTYTLVETLPATGYQGDMYIDGMVTSKYEFEVKDNVILKIDVYNKVIDAPSTGIDVSSTYVIGGLSMFVGISTITVARKKREV